MITSPNDSAEYVIGLDYGTDSVRAVLVNAKNGENITTSIYSYPRWQSGRYCKPDSFQFRHHPLDYVEGAEHTIRDIVDRYPSEVAQVKAISVDTTASTPCLVDEHLVPLSLKERYKDNPDAMFVLWKDHTAEVESQEINRLCKAAKVNYARHTGNYYSAECFWSKVLHLVRNNKDLDRDTFTAIELCDWIPAILAGVGDIRSHKVSHCAAGSKHLWSEEWGGFPPTEFFEALHPSLVKIVENMNSTNYTADQAVGTLSEHWAKRLGLSTDVVIGVGNIDSHSGAVGAGVSQGSVVLNIGTSACYMAVMPTDKFGTQMIDGVFGQVNSSIVPGMVGFELGLSAFGDVYAWLKRLLCYTLKETMADTPFLDARTKNKILKRAEETAIGRLSKDAEKLKIKFESPVATDWLNGRRSPNPDSSLTGTISGISLATSAPEIYYALVEATAFATKAAIDHMRNNGIEVNKLIGVGGVSQKSPFVMQTLANVLQECIYVTDVQQAGAMGAACYAATTAGIYSSIFEAQKSMCNPKYTVYTPDPTTSELLMRRYERYVAVGQFSEQQQHVNN